MIMPADRKSVTRQLQIERMSPISDAHVQCFHFERQFRVELQNIALCLDAGGDPLYQVNGACHRPKMHALSEVVPC